VHKRMEMIGDVGSGFRTVPLHQRSQGEAAMPEQSRMGLGDNGDNHDKD